VSSHLVIETGSVPPSYMYIEEANGAMQVCVK
jgi:hypothetical protein